MIPEGRSERDEAVDRAFEQVEADMAERLSRPPAEDEIARGVAALERAERLQRLREQAKGGDE